MEIKKVKPVELMLSFHRLELSYKDKKKVIDLLNCTGLILKDEPYFNEAKHTLTIKPYDTHKEIEYWITPEELRAQLKAKPVVINFADFEGGDDFYKKISKKKSPAKIISDSFSRQRGSALYELIAKLEANLREYFLSERNNLNTDQYISPKNKNSNTPDDEISRYNLTEIFQKFLLSPSNDRFFLENLVNAKNQKGYIQARKLKKIDELGLPFSESDFVRFTRIRNSIMHFRVVTYQDSAFLVNFYEKMMFYDFSKSMQEISINIHSR